MCVSQAARGDPWLLKRCATSMNAEEKEKRGETELCRVSRNIMQSFDSAAERRYFLVPRSRVRMPVGVDLREIVYRFSHFSHISVESAVSAADEEPKLDIRLYLSSRRFEDLGLEDRYKNL